MNADYLQLIATLEQGWVVVPPVYLRPRWTNDNKNVYHFIMKQGDDSTKMITVSDDAIARSFIEAHQLQVIK
jgi:hypothetical protein